MLNQPLQSGEFERYSDDPLVGVHPQIANPFPGLRPFSVDECHLFFGREGQVDKILLQLSKNRFVAVMGFSGSGKSSLMNCGLVPVLYGGFITENGANWNVITARPGASPIANLTDAIVDFMSQTGKINPEDKEIHRAIVNSVLRSGSYGLLEVARYVQLQTDENILLLIDQFEELFRYQETDGSNPDAADEAHQYVHLMLTAVNQTKAPIYVAITMRSDFIGNCSAFPGLTQIINQSNYLVPQMTREQKKMVIEGPIAVAGGKIAPRLLRTLLSDIGNDQDQLPILQHAMMRTWDYWLMNHEPGEPIDIRHYNAVGKISQALSQHADEAYEELSPRQKEIAEVLFKSITERTQENRGMRRPTRLGLIAQLADAEEADVIDIVNHFRKPGRSFLMPAYHVSLHSDSMVEISHESLMRIWTRLDSWVAEEFDSAQMYKRLSEAAAMYQIGKTGLWRPPDLQLALNWQKKQRPTREWAQRYDEAFERAVVFLDTSRITYEAELKNQEMLQRRLLRRTRATAIIFGILFVIAILFFVFAFMKKLEADEQTRFAESQRKEADQQKQEADKQRVEAERLRGVAEASRAMIEEANKELEKTLNELQTEKDRAESALIKSTTGRAESQSGKPQ
ncbi:MAG: hypothetical protein HC859_02880 [Bacteroidia bacterium]|nr:hypothetical protein [Bacteroidia bacterium]